MVMMDGCSCCVVVVVVPLPLIIYDVCTRIEYVYAREEEQD
jgi:hypothetical protein